MPEEIEVGHDALLFLGAFLLLGGITATAMMIVLLRRAWRWRVAEHRNPPGRPECIVADEGWWDGIARLVLVLTTTTVGAIFAIGILEGNLHLQGVAGFILAGIFLIQGGIPLYQQIHSLHSQQKLTEAIRKMRRNTVSFTEHG